MAAALPRFTDLTDIEAVPLADRGLPESTYTLLSRAATLWPERTALTVLPEAARWREPVRRTFANLLADVHRYANLLCELGVRRCDAVALMTPNRADLVPATLAAQLAGVAAPLNGGLSRVRSEGHPRPIRHPVASRGATLTSRRLVALQQTGGPVAVTRRERYRPRLPSATTAKQAVSCERRS